MPRQTAKARRATWLLVTLLALVSVVGLPRAVATGPQTPAAPEAITSIYDIQYTTDPGSGTYPSPLAGQVVTTTGVVYAVYSGQGFCISDATGPWHGTSVYYPSGTMPSLGDEVEVEGEVVEYYGFTELGNYATYTILSSGNPVYLYAPDAYRASDHDPVVVSLFAPDLAISKDVTPMANVELGGVVTYTIELDNTGMSDALGVEMIDALPNEVHFGGWLEQPAGATQADDIVTWIGDVTNGMQVTVIFTAAVGTNSAFYGQTVTNSAAFSSTNAGSDSASAAFDIISAPALIIVKDVTPVANVPLDGIVTYSILLANSGDGAARDVTMSDVLPIEVSFGGWIIRHQAEVISDTITWSGDIGGQKDVQIVFTATVGADPSLSGQTVTNTAEYASPIHGSGSDDATFTITGAPDRIYIYLPVVMRND